MKIEKCLLKKMNGYDALLYSAMCQLLHPYDDLLEVSNEYLMGRIFELSKCDFSKSLSRLEENGYIKTFHQAKGNPFYYLKESITPGEYLVIDSMADRMMNPAERVFNAYINDIFNSGRKRIKIKEMQRILNPVETYDDPIKNWDAYLEEYNVFRTDNVYYTLIEPVNSVAT